MTGIAATARWTAAVRALESERADALFHDPWAALLAGDEGRTWAASRAVEGLTPMVLRTRFFDDLVEREARAGAAQVVLLGAGLDTRALRLRWPPGITVFELDRREVMQDKQEALRGAGASPRCAHHVCVDADLSDPDWPEWLVGAGLDRRAVCVWVAEGCLFYLPEPVVTALLERVSELSTAGSRLGFDIPNGAALTHPLTRPWVEMQAALGAPWLSTLDDPAAPLAALGWDATVTQFGEPDAAYGRWPYPVPPIARGDLPHHWLVTARR